MKETALRFKSKEFVEDTKNIENRSRQQEKTLQIHIILPSPIILGQTDQGQLCMWLFKLHQSFPSLAILRAASCLRHIHKKWDELKSTDHWRETLCEH